MENCQTGGLKKLTMNSSLRCFFLYINIDKRVLMLHWVIQFKYSLLNNCHHIECWSIYMDSCGSTFSLGNFLDQCQMLKLKMKYKKILKVSGEENVIIEYLYSAYISQFSESMCLKKKWMMASLCFHTPQSASFTFQTKWIHVSSVWTDPTRGLNHAHRQLAVC